MDAAELICYYSLAVGLFEDAFWNVRGWRTGV